MGIDINNLQNTITGYDRSLYSDSDYGKQYIKYRWMPVDAFEKYFMHTISALGRTPMRILDIGSGTGQFSIRLAERLSVVDEAFRIDAIDGSKSQLKLLNKHAEEDNLKCIHTYNCDFSEFSVEEKYDLIICSEMIHTVDDLFVFVLKINKALNGNGVLCIRTSNPEQLLKRSTYQFFPKCRFLDLSRNKSAQLITAAFALVGQYHITSVEVDESKLLDSNYVVGLFENKAYSTLHYLDDDEYNTGLVRMKEAYAMQEKVLLDFFMTMYIIKRV